MTRLIYGHEGRLMDDGTTNVESKVLENEKTGAVAWKLDEVYNVDGKADLA